MPLIKRIVLQNPLLPAALCLIGCLVGILVSPVGWVVAGLALIPPALLKMWREFLLCLILAIFASGIALKQQNAYQAALLELQSLQGSQTEIEGSVIRCLSHSVWVKPDAGKAAIEIIPPENTAVKTGEKWRFTGIVTEIAPPRIPGAFDRPAWLKRNNVIGRIVAHKAEWKSPGNTWSRILARSESWRHHVAQILQAGAPPDDPDAAIMVSLLLGEKDGLTPEIFQDFKASGSLHIFAVSGLHIGIASLIILWTLRLLRMHPIRARLATIPFLVLYVFVTGMPVSAMRALVMIVILFTSMSFREKSNSLNTLSFTAIVFLMWNPMQLLDAGFQLSFAIFGVITVGSMWGNTRKPLWSPDPFIPIQIYSSRERFLVGRERSIRLLILLSICCWLAAIPLTIANFGTFNLYSALTNTLMAPIIPIIMAMCMLAIIFSWSFPILVLINVATRQLAHVLLLLSQGVATLPGALTPATAPASGDSFMLIPHYNGACTVVLGNPGLVINGGSPENIRYSVIPALQAKGFTPKAHLLAKPQKALVEGASSFNATYPDITQLGVASSLKLPHTLTNGEGGITILPPSETTAYGIMDDRCPVILWNHHGKKLLYLGDSSHLNALHLPRETAAADVLIIGKHSKDPIDQPEWILSTGAQTVIFTSPPHEELLEELEGKAHVYTLNALDCVVLKLE